MSGKCRPSLRAKVLEHIETLNRNGQISETDFNCINEVFRRFEKYQKQESDELKIRRKILNLEHLHNVVNANPELPIVAVVNGQIKSSYDIWFNVSDINSIEVCEYALYRGTLYTDRDAFKAKAAEYEYSINLDEFATIAFKPAIIVKVYVEPISDCTHKKMKETSKRHE